MDKVEIDRLIGVVRELSFAHDVEAVTGVVRRAARDLTGADGVSVILRDGDQAHYVDENAIAPLWKGRRFPLSQCVSGWVMAERQSVAIEDVFADPRVPADLYRPTFVKSLAMVPIRRENPVGALGAYWASPHRARPEEMEALERLADTAVVALANARLYRQLEGALKAAEIRAEQLVRLNDRMRKEVVHHVHTEEMLRHAHKMESLGRLAGGVAHDFNNLLTVIAGNSDLIISGGETPEQQVEAAREIYAAAQRGAALTRQLLAFSRKQIVRPVLLDLNWVVERMEQMLTRLIGEHVRLSTNYGHDLGSVKADLGQIEQVIMNLVLNARDAMPQGGEIAVATRNAEVAGGHEGHVPEGSYVVLAVGDTGVGMDEETKKQMFDPFFTTKDGGRGGGLGLSTVHGIITQSGGYIRVVTAPGQGTTFAIYLPRVQERAEAPGNGLPPEALELTDKMSGTILLVEDEVSIRNLVGGALRSAGFTVLEAGDGDTAKATSASHPGMIDLLLTDSVLPHLSGPDLCGEIMEVRPGIRVIFMSGYTDAEVFARSQKYGGAFLQKPFTMDELQRTVRETLAAPPPNGHSE